MICCLSKLKQRRKKPTSWKHQAQLGCTARHCLHVLAPLVVHTLEPGTNTWVTSTEMIHFTLYADQWLPPQLITKRNHKYHYCTESFFVFFLCFVFYMMPPGASLRIKTLKRGGPAWKPTLWTPQERGFLFLLEWNRNTTETKTNLQKTAVIWVKVKTQKSILRAGGAPILVRSAANELWSESAQAQKNWRRGSCLHLQPTQLNKKRCMFWGQPLTSQSTELIMAPLVGGERAACALWWAGLRL